MFANEIISAIKLNLAEEKTEALLTVGKKNTITNRIVGHTITTKPVANYLEMTINIKLNFW